MAALSVYNRFNESLSLIYVEFENQNHIYYCGLETAICEVIYFDSGQCLDWEVLQFSACCCKVVEKGGTLDNFFGLFSMFFSSLKGWVLLLCKCGFL